MGHLHSTVIRVRLRTLKKSGGYEPIRINHRRLGAQFGNSSKRTNYGVVKELVVDPIAELIKLAVRFHEEAEQTQHWMTKVVHGSEIEDGDLGGSSMGMVQK